jgi:hypothetical protein
VLEYLAIQVDNFSAGSPAWPILKGRVVANGRTRGAELFGRFLARCFPRLRQAHVFFTWENESPRHLNFTDPPTYPLHFPNAQIVDLPLAFFASWKAAAAQRPDASLEWVHADLKL